MPRINWEKARYENNKVRIIDYLEKEIDIESYNEQIESRKNYEM